MFKNAQAYWDEYIKETSYKHPEGDGFLTGCNCSYEILDAQVQINPLHPDFGLDFISTNNCPGSTTDNCIYFSGYHYTDCFSLGNNPNCVNEWVNLPPAPINRFAFNCTPPAYSSFGALLQSAYSEPDNDCIGDYIQSTITFRIVCVETCENYSYLAYSPSITLTFDGPIGGNWYDGSERTIIELHGCGCTPTTVF